MKRFLPLFAFVVGMNAIFAGMARAICPICTIAVGAGVGLSRWLGVDDSITGLWIGALLVSITIWTLGWFDARKISFPARGVITAMGYYAITLIPLYFAHFFVHPVTLFSFTLDKLIIGVTVGSFAFWTAALWYEHMKRNNGGHAYFPYQKVAMPVVLLVVLSAVYYWLTI